MRVRFSRIGKLDFRGRIALAASQARAIRHKTGTVVETARIVRMAVREGNVPK
jgi:hypothetical protein